MNIWMWLNKMCPLLMGILEPFLVMIPGWFSVSPQWSTASCTIFGWVTTTAMPILLVSLHCYCYQVKKKQQIMMDGNSKHIHANRQVVLSSGVFQVGVPSGSVTCGTCRTDASAWSLSDGRTYCTWVSSRGGLACNEQWQIMLKRSVLFYDVWWWL